MKKYFLLFFICIFVLAGCGSSNKQQGITNNDIPTNQDSTSVNEDVSNNETTDTNLTGDFNESSALNGEGNLRNINDIENNDIKKITPENSFDNKNDNLDSKDINNIDNNESTGETKNSQKFNR